MAMGWSAARKLRRAIDGLMRVVAIELLTAARGLDLRCAALGPAPAPVTAAVVAALRQHVDGPGPDRYLASEIEHAVRLTGDGTLLAAARAVTEIR